MYDLQWFNEYSGQTADELILLEGKYRTDSLIVAFEQALDQKAAKFGDDSLSEEELVIVAIEALETEVNNGGYDQFFRNSSNEYTPIIVDSLNRIGCNDVAILTQRAIDSLGIEGPITVNNVQDAISKNNEGRDNILDECDQEYYAKADGLAIPLFEFIKKNKDKINIQYTR